MLEVSSPETEGELQVSKSRKLPLLLDESEMASLFDALGDFEIFDSSRPVEEEGVMISKEAFLNHYSTYVHNLREGKGGDESLLRPYFSSFMSRSREAAYAMPLRDGRFLVKSRRPVVQLRRHHFIFSEGQFHSGVMGESSITWGIEFSYPHLFLDPKTKAIGKIDASDAFPNTPLFQTLARWVRNETLPTPFLVEEKVVNQPIRLGKRCFEWINNHPGLNRSKLYVESKRNPSSAH